MKKLVIILFTFFACNSFIKPDSKIVWCAERPLTWEDYKEKPNNANPHDAGSSVGISYQFNSKSNTIEIFTVFHPLESWVKKDQKSLSLLNHEQGHFNITEIYARKLRQMLTGKHFKENKFHKTYEGIYDQIVKDMERTQEIYDLETDYSKYSGVQSAWNGKIDAELEALKDWSDVEVSVIIE